MDEIWCDMIDHILDHLGCGQTWGLAPTCINIYKPSTYEWFIIVLPCCAIIQQVEPSPSPSSFEAFRVAPPWSVASRSCEVDAVGEAAWRQNWVANCILDNQKIRNDKDDCGWQIQMLESHQLIISRILSFANCIYWTLISRILWSQQWCYDEPIGWLKIMTAKRPKACELMADPAVLRFSTCRMPLFCFRYLQKPSPVWHCLDDFTSFYICSNIPIWSTQKP